jgi:hypothetical protein
MHVCVTATDLAPFMLLPFAPGSQEVLAAARREAEERLAAAAAAHEESIEQLGREYRERIDALRHELSADSAHRLEADSRAAGLKAQHAASLEAVAADAREAHSKLALAQAQVVQLQQGVAAAQERADAAEAHAMHVQQVVWAFDVRLGMGSGRLCSMPSV